MDLENTNYMDLEKYIDLLQRFIDDDRSHDLELLSKISQNKVNKDSFVKLYDDISLQVNYQIFLHGKEEELFFKVINDFKIDNIGGHSWLIKDKNYMGGRYSINFISNSLNQYIQIENLNSYSRNYLDDLDKSILIDGFNSAVKFMFSGIPNHIQKYFQDGTVFKRDRDLARTIVAISDYLKENRIPAHINLIGRNFHPWDEPLLVTYNPNNAEIKYK